MSKAHEEKKRIAFPIQLFRESGESFAELPDEIHVVPVGEWDHPAYGLMKITSSDIKEFIRNFKDKVRRDLPITAGHDNGMSGGELPAIGWFKDLIDRGIAGLYAVVEWTDQGKQLLSEGAFKYFSPEFYETYEDPETRKIFNHVLVGGALTNKPYFKELQAVVSFSEPTIMSQFNDNKNTMDINTIVAKKVEELSDEEKAFLVEHKEELSAEQKTAFASVIGETSTEETEEEKTAREEKEKGDANEAAGLNRDGSPKEVSASEKNKGMVMISAAEKSALEAKANQGAQAFAELEKMKLGEQVNKMVFSDTNKDGRFFSKQKDAVVAFMSELSSKQRDQFVNIVNNMPKAEKIFGEKGDNGKDVNADVFAEVDSKVKELQKTNAKLSYADGLKQVFAADPELAKKYESREA